MRKHFSTVSGVLFFAAFAPYIVAILLGEARPSPISWGVWLLNDFLIFRAMKKSQSGALGQIKGAVAGAAIVFFLSLFVGKVEFGYSDLIAGVGALVAFAFIRSDGDRAIIAANAAVFAASLSSFSTGWYTPEQEDPIAWMIWFVSCIFALLALNKDEWDIKNALQPITFTVIETVMLVLVVILPHLK